MMEFETWSRDTLIKELTTAMISANFKSQGDFLGMPITLKIYTNKELHQKTDYELRSIYVQYKRHDDAFCKEYEECEEKKRFFNQEACEANFAYWSKQAYWSIDEAIVLALGKDPRKVQWENVKPYLSKSPFAKKFHEIRELAKRYVNCNQLFDPVLPGIFLAWAERMNISISDALKDAVSAIGIQVADWKGHYDKTIEQYNQLNNLYTEALEIIKMKEKIIEVLNLRIFNFEMNQEQPHTDNLKSTERQSLYKLVAAMAYDGYGYNPSDKKSAIPKEISDAVTERLGENIDSDTARKWLKKATGEYPSQILDKTE
jgi:hypothetical protein